MNVSFADSLRAIRPCASRGHVEQAALDFFVDDVAAVVDVRLEPVRGFGVLVDPLFAVARGFDEAVARLPDFALDAFDVRLDPRVTLRDVVVRLRRCRPGGCTPGAPKTSGAPTAIPTNADTTRDSTRLVMGLLPTGTHDVRHAADSFPLRRFRVYGADGLEETIPAPGHASAWRGNARGLACALSCRVRFSPSSRGRLTDRDLARFPGDTLFDRVARAVCCAGCLPRKELYEAWETARRVRRLFRGGRPVDLGSGHGLLAHLLLILDDTSTDALAVDAVIPPSAATLHEALLAQWPRLAGRVHVHEGPLESVALRPADIVVSIHACGRLTDVVLDRAVAARARVAVLPCCHDFEACDGGGLSGWMDDALAIDATRARRLAGAGYRIWTQVIPETITPKNRLLMGAPITMPADRPGSEGGA